MSDEVFKLKEQEQSWSADHIESAGSSDDHDGAWVVGIVFVLAGGVILLSRIFGFSFDNWWAFFILIPAAGALGHALTTKRRTGRFGEDGYGALCGAFFFSFLFAMFMFGLNWAMFWPVFLIGAGLAMVGRNFLK